MARGNVRSEIPYKDRLLLEKYKTVKIENLENRRMQELLTAMENR